ncbi:MAG: YmfQ family protein [Lachnospiraceae bacterium]|nr:YmfQ family protein [Lachnospiraceae bacterium]
MQQFAEIKEITGAEDAWMDSIQEMSGKILDNAFIQDCDIQGIKKYENMLGIIPDIAASLEDRKQDVLMHINNKPPYTYKTLLNKLEVLYGAGNYEVSLDLARYIISIKVHSELRGQKKVVETMLGWFLPVNMEFTAVNEVLRNFIINIPEEMDIIKIHLHTQLNFWECDILNGTRLLDGTVLLDAKKRYSLVLGIKNGIKFSISGNMDTDRVYIKILSCFSAHESIGSLKAVFKLGRAGFWLPGSGNAPGEYNMPLKVTLPVKASVVQGIGISGLVNGIIKVCTEEKTGAASVSRASINFWQDGRQAPDSMYQGVQAGTRHMAEAFIFETIGDVTITCHRNLYYIDGTEPLDGSRLVNAFHGKENI